MNDAETRARLAAARVWAGRARAESEAAARFAGLAEALARVDAVAPVIAMAREAAADEVRHAELCRQLVGSLGGTPPEPVTVSAPVVAPRALLDRERVLYEVVAMSCVTETLSAALLGEMVERATDPDVRDTMRVILRDEIGHSRLGWAHLAAEQRRGVADVVGAHLPAILRGTVQEELFFSWGEPEEHLTLAGLGALDRPSRLEGVRGDNAAACLSWAFALRDRHERGRSVAVVEIGRELNPGLSRFGIDTSAGEAWLSSKAGGAG